MPDRSSKTDGRVARRQDTERRIVEAVGELLRQGGLGALGVNAVAKQAGVDKVLIYRYFGDLPGLLKQYGETVDFWPTLDELLGPERALLDEPDPARLGRMLFANYAGALLNRPVTMDLLAWECVTRNALTAALEEVRERRSDELFRALADSGVELTREAAMVAGLFAAAMNYLVVRSRGIKTFAGLDLDSPEGWEQIFQAMGSCMSVLTPRSPNAR